ncbi:hypothetical protein D3C73_1431580 [compost metagenome]
MECLPLPLDDMDIVENNAQLLLPVGEGMQQFFHTGMNKFRQAGVVRALLQLFGQSGQQIGNEDGG